MDRKIEILSECIKNKLLIDKNILDLLSNCDTDLSNSILNYIFNLKNKGKIINMDVFVKNRIEIEKIFGENYTDFIKRLYSDVKSLGPSAKNKKNIDIHDFIRYFRDVYSKLSSIIMENSEIKNIKSIRRITNGDNCNIIVSVFDKKITKNGNILLKVEDMTGYQTVIIDKNREKLYESVKKVLIDEVIGLNVSSSGDILFANELFLPTTKINSIKKSEEDVSIAVISDIHIGSVNFLDENFKNFINWINGDEPLAKNIKYLFIVGDSVDGVGVFDGQNEFLNIKDIYLQYERLSEYLSMIRKDIKIIICPGQHDASWIGEPQSPINKGVSSGLYKLSNVSLVSNPSLINIFGLNILVYHGAGVHSINRQIPEIRSTYGYKEPTKLISELVKKRCLNVTYGEADRILTAKNDELIIDNIPDIILTGDLHRSESSIYNNILLVSGSCWQKQTPFEEKIGNIPLPCVVPIVNLKNREIDFVDFSDLNKISIKKENG